MTTGGRRRMGVEERRGQLIAVALDLFSRRPPEHVSMDEVAAAAGISRPLVYHYFPGRNSLYEAAVRRAADELTARFVEPVEGPFGARLKRVMGRYFDFVDEHGPGFSALLRGGTAVGPTSAGAVIDEVRRAAYAQVLAHLGVAAPGPALSLVIRSWVGLAETAALTWLESRQVPRAELELQLVQDFLALAAVTAGHDAETAGVVRRVLAEEPPDGPFGALLSRLWPLVPGATAGPAPSAAATAASRLP